MRESGRQRVAPLYLGDVTAAIVVAMDPKKPDVFDLLGPDEMVMDNLVRLLNTTDGAIKHALVIAVGSRPKSTQTQGRRKRRLSGSEWKAGLGPDG